MLVLQGYLTTGPEPLGIWKWEIFWGVQIFPVSCVLWSLFVLADDTQRWQSFGSPVPIDEEHQSGEGSDKQRFCPNDWVFSPLFQSCSCGIIRARVANWDYSLRLCAFWNTLETKQQLHMCKLDLATWKSYDTTNMTRYEFTMEQPCTRILAKAAGGIFLALPLRHLPWWPGRVAYPSDQCIPFGLQVLSSVDSWKTIFFHLKTIFLKHIEVTNMQASDGCIQIWCGATSKWKSWTLSSTVVTISPTMSKAMNLTLPRHTESEKVWQISMASFDFVWFLTLSWDSHRCGFFFHWFGGIWNGVCLPHACLFGHLWARCQWFGQSLLWS